MKVYFLTTILIGASILNLSAQGADEIDSLQSLKASVGGSNPIDKDSLGVDLNSTYNTVKEEVKDKLEGVVVQKDGLAEEATKQKSALKQSINQSLEGEGITNENAPEKISNLLSQEGNKIEELGQRAAGVVEKDVSIDDKLSTHKNILEKVDNPLQDAGAHFKDLPKVYSEKQLNFAYDTLLKNVDWNVVNALLRNPQSVSQQELFAALYLKFPGLKDLAAQQQDARMFGVMLEGGDPYRVMASLAAVHLHDLSSYRPSSDSLMEHLPALKGRQLGALYDDIQNKYLLKLDSIRKVNLKQEGLKLKEKKLSNLSTETLIKRKNSFLRKFYFEGIAGLLNGSVNGNFNLFQISPALGYHLTKDFSIGVGPNILLQRAHSKFQGQAGIRSFAKYEFLKYRFYLQAEDMVTFPRIDREIVQENALNTQHSVFSGAGYLLPISKRLALNFSLLYRMVSTSDAPQINSSPWIYRIGLSSMTVK